MDFNIQGCTDLKKVVLIPLTKTLDSLMFSSFKHLFNNMNRKYTFMVLPQFNVLIQFI